MHNMYRASIILLYILILFKQAMEIFTRDKDASPREVRTSVRACLVFALIEDYGVCVAFLSLFDLVRFGSGFAWSMVILLIHMKYKTNQVELPLFGTLSPTFI